MRKSKAAGRHTAVEMRRGLAHSWWKTGEITEPVSTKKRNWANSSPWKPEQAADKASAPGRGSEKTVTLDFAHEKGLSKITGKGTEL
jgi:hypothetical protein